MGSLPPHQPYLSEGEWKYEGLPESYGFQDSAYPQHQPSYVYYPDTSMAPQSAGAYMPHGPSDQHPGGPVFHMPSTPASALRQYNGESQDGSLSADSDFDRHAKRIKRTRTACEECRKRKQKCDGGEPCQSCDEQGTECKYRDVPPTKKDDSMDKMIRLAEMYNKTLVTLNSDIDVMNSALRSIETRLNNGWQARHDPEVQTKGQNQHLPARNCYRTAKDAQQGSPTSSSSSTSPRPSI